MEDKEKRKLKEGEKYEEKVAEGRNRKKRRWRT
jgi:hypothetical protein